MSQAVAERIEPDTSVAPVAEVAGGGVLTPMQMAYQLIQNGAELGSVKEMLAMSRELAADQARRAFDAALSAAKAEIPPILKNRVVDFTSAKGRTNYRHEDMGEIARTVDPILARHGLSYRFRTEQETGGGIKVTCVVAHRDGHAEENALTASRDESGNKNNIQAVGSTITYLQRYTLKAALGLAASNDDDGRKHGQAQDEPADAISVEQRDELLKLIGETDTDVALFCKYYKIEAVPDLPSNKFESAKKRLEEKKAGK
jgi:hypothetical protein